MLLSIWQQRNLVMCQLEMLWTILQPHSAWQRVENYTTWREKTSLGRQSVTELVQKNVERVKNLVTQM